MSRWWIGLLLASPLLSGGSCGSRSPGPDDGDRGKVTHWVVESADQSFEQCSDAPGVQITYGDPAELIGVALSYRLSDDGRTAEGLACTSTDEADCEPLVPPRVYSVSGNRLEAELRPLEVPVVGLDCQQFILTRWTLVDEGDVLSFSRLIQHELTGTATACDVVEEVYVELSTNGFGIRDCEIRLTGEASFVEVR